MCLSWHAQVRPGRVSARACAVLSDRPRELTTTRRPSRAGTATAKVIQDIRTILRFDKDVPCLMGVRHIFPFLFVAEKKNSDIEVASQTFNRPNIQYSVRFKESLDATKPQGALSETDVIFRNENRQS